MSEWIRLTAQDGFELAAYVAKPAGEAIGALVVVQEIFGVNKSIRDTCDGWAADGFYVVAPALFDRFERDVDLGYGPEDLKLAFGKFYGMLKPETTLLDVAAAFEQAQTTGKGVGVLGYCYGGLAAWLAAVRGETYKMQPDCCVGFYAGGVGNFATEEPSCPVMLHFGSSDDHIGPEQREAVQAAHPEVEIYVYEGAGHAFANPDRPSYAEEAAKLARERSLAFLKTHIA